MSHDSFDEKKWKSEEAGAEITTIEKEIAHSQNSEDKLEKPSTTRWSKVANAISSLASVSWLSICWVEKRLEEGAKHWDQRYLVILLAVIISISFIVSCMLYEKWPDIYSVSGFYISLFGFAFTLFEVYRTRIVTQIAQEAAKSAAKKQNSEHYKHCLDRARSHILEVEILVKHKKWTIASWRIKDLVRDVVHIHSIRSHANDRWEKISEQFHDYSGKFERGNPPDYDKVDFAITILKLTKYLEEELAPMTFNGLEDASV